MATSAEAQALLDRACDQCTIPPGMIWYAVLAALINYSNGDTVSTDPQVVLNEARCLECVIPPGFVGYAILEAVRDLSVSGGGGGGGVTCGAVDPVAAPSGSCGIYYRTDTGTIFVWDGATWV